MSNKPDVRSRSWPASFVGGLTGGNAEQVRGSDGTERGCWRPGAGLSVTMYCAKAARVRAGEGTSAVAAGQEVPSVPPGAGLSVTALRYGGAGAGQ